MFDEKTVRAIKFSGLNGISKKQIEEHHDVLYAGYVKKFNEIQKEVKSSDLSKANATFSQIRELKIEETFALNAIKLHEGYFDALGGNGLSKGKILRLISEDFGSFENWEAEFKAMGLSARGWVVLAFDIESGRLHNFLSDVHNQGGVWGCMPLLILDVYEHAYFIDYMTGRKTYIDAFMKNVNWEFVESIVDRNNIVALRSQALSQSRK